MDADADHQREAAALARLLDADHQREAAALACLLESEDARRRHADDAIARVLGVPAAMPAPTTSGIAWHFMDQAVRMRRVRSRVRMEIDLERVRRPLLYRNRRSYSR